MLAGQEIGVYETLMISLAGMTVAMVSLFILMLFIIVVSKIIVGFSNIIQKQEDIASEEEIAVIASVICAETGLKPDEFKIKTITIVK